MYIKEWQAREGKGKREKNLLQIKIRVIEILYNFVILGDKVKQISNIPQGKAAKERVRIEMVWEF